MSLDFVVVTAAVVADDDLAQVGVAPTAGGARQDLGDPAVLGHQYVTWKRRRAATARAAAAARIRFMMVLLCQGDLMVDRGWACLLRPRQSAAKSRQSRIVEEWPGRSFKICPGHLANLSSVSASTFGERQAALERLENNWLITLRPVALARMRQSTANFCQSAVSGSHASFGDLDDIRGRRRGVELQQRLARQLVRVVGNVF